MSVVDATAAAPPPSSLATEIPDILSSNVNNEAQTTTLESVIQEAESFVFAPNSLGKTRFVLQKKGDVLASDGVLIYKLNWKSFDAAQDRCASLVRQGGALASLENARLYYDGKLISETRQVGQRLAIEQLFKAYGNQVEVEDKLHGGNRQYSYSDDTGLLVLKADVERGLEGCREIVNSTTSNLEVSVRLDDLFPLMRDLQIPTTALRGDIVVEIDFNAKFQDVIVESGAVAFTPAEREFEIVRPRLHLDYITYDNMISEAFRMSVNSPQGQTRLYRSRELVTAQLPAITGTSQETDVELGFAGRRVLKMYVQKRAVGFTNTGLIRQTRSDGLNQEQMQLIVNNKLMFDQPVDLDAEFYSHLNQTGAAPASIMAGEYGFRGKSANASSDTIENAAVYPRAQGSAAVVAAVQEQFQGRQKYLGVNFAKTRAGNDTPLNAVSVGQAPMILRLSRSKTSLGDATSDDAETNGAVLLNIWIESAKALVLANGRVDTINV